MCYLHVQRMLQKHIYQHIPYSLTRKFGKGSDLENTPRKCCCNMILYQNRNAVKLGLTAEYQCASKPTE